MSNEQPPISPRELAVKWLDITVDRFTANIASMRILHTAALLVSFRKQVIGAAEGDELKLRLSYALYGKFVDMGVGRGMGKGITRTDDGYNRLRNGRGQLKHKPRAPRPWYSTEIFHQTMRLAELMQELRGRAAFSTITEALPTAPTEVNL